MRPSAALELHREDIRRIVASRHARNPRVFGSVLHGKDTEDSDLDILVDTTSRTSLFDLNAISNALEALLGVPVDVLTPKSLPAEWRDQVLVEAKPV